MGALYLTEMADWFRAAGLDVVEYDGWKTRSRSSGGYESGRPWGVMWHHTASSTSPENDANYMCHGSSDRPIANLLIARNGFIWVLAAGATNTNGKGSGVVWSRGRVPDDSMNTYAVGMEIACNGVGEPYSEAQINGAFGASVTLVQRLGLAPTDVAEHFTWAPTRKIDPATASAVQGPWQPASCTSSGTWDVNDLIAEHQRRVAPGPGPTPPTPDDDEDDMPQWLVVHPGTGEYLVTDLSTYATYVPSSGVAGEGRDLFGWRAGPDGGPWGLGPEWAGYLDQLPRTRP